MLNMQPFKPMKHTFTWWVQHNNVHLHTDDKHKNTNINQAHYRPQTNLTSEIWEIFPMNTCVHTRTHTANWPLLLSSILWRLWCKVLQKNRVGKKTIWREAWKCFVDPRCLQWGATVIIFLSLGARLRRGFGFSKRSQNICPAQPCLHNPLSLRV